MVNRNYISISRDFAEKHDMVNVMNTKNIFLIILAIPLLIGVLILCGFIYKRYALWSAEMQGKQELARAEGNRKIVIQEALAKKEAANYLSDAEILRAKGVAEANKIIGESLKNNESYLRYLWINNLDHSTEKQVIYVPTEANLPILEAGKR
jgi:hypothetical protein